MAVMPYTWFVKQVATSQGQSSEDYDRSSASSTASGEEDAPVWVPLRRTDQKRLESAILSSEIGLDDVDSVTVDGGRCEVKIRDRCFVDCFGSVPPPPVRPVRRALWLRYCEAVNGDGAWQPYNESFDDLIERAYQALQSDVCASMAAMMPTSHFQREVPLPDGSGGVLQLQLVFEDKSGWSLYAQERHKPQTNHPGWLRPQRRCEGVPVKRGYGQVFRAEGEVEEQLLGQEISHLIILVHSFDGDSTSVATGKPIRSLRRNLHRSQLHALGFDVEAIEDGWGGPEEDDDDLKQGESKVEVIEVFWEQGTVCGSINCTLQDRLDRVTPPSMPRVREMANRIACGALLYARQRDEILAAVADSVEAALWRFQAHRPDFAGDVVLVGHSLGGLALFELLLEERLSFEARALYALGSPIGLLMDTVDSRVLEESCLPCGTRFFNIFHPLDPVAYRVEPLLMPELGRKPAEKVPRRRFSEEILSPGISSVQSVQVFLKNGDDSDTESIASSLGRPAHVPERPSNRGSLFHLQLRGRVDWVLQGEIGLEAIQPSMSQRNESGRSSVLSVPRMSISPRMSKLEEADLSRRDVDIAPLAGHSCYLRSPDVAAFIYASSILLGYGLGTDHPLPEEPGKLLDNVGPLGILRSAGSVLGLGLSKTLEMALKETRAKDRVQQAAGHAGKAAKDVSGAAKRTYEESGAADIVKGTAAAAGGVFGTARAVYGTVRLVGTGIGAARGAVGGVAGVVNGVLSSPRGSQRSA